MVIAAQLTLIGFHGHGNLDYLLEDAMEFQSSTLEAVWWEAPDGSSIVAIGNSSARLVDVEIDADGQKERSWIAPFATIQKQLVAAPHSSNGNVRYLHVSSTTALTGDLQATGFSADETVGDFHTIQFLDPATSTEPALYSNGLHFSNSNNHLVVRNIGGSRITVGGDLFLLGGKPPANKLPIIAQAVAPGAAVELRLPSPKAATEMDGAALMLRSSGQRGSIVAAFSSFDPARQLARYVPFKDIGRHQVSTGGYPWRLDGDFESTIYITNVGKVRAAFGGLIRPENGNNYVVDTHYLEVGETAVIDIRQIRDLRIADRDGVRLPDDTLMGHFEWSTLFGDGTQRLIGRQEVISPAIGVSSSFSCAGCSCPNSVSSAWVSPGSPVVFVGDNQSIVATAGVTNTCGGVQGSYTIYPTSWQIGAPGYFSITPNSGTSNMRGVSPGNSSFYTPFDGVVYVFNGQGCFTPPGGPPHLNPGGTGNVPNVDHMMVVADTTGLCDGCTRTIARYVRYQVQQSNNQNMGVIQMGEFTATGSNSCGGGMPTTTSCSSSKFYTDYLSQFVDEWSIDYDAPAGCGFDVYQDTWRWCKPLGGTQDAGTLSGYIHSDSISIKGYVTPNKMPQGFIVKP